MNYIGWTWLGIIVACIIIEASTMGLTTIWFAIGAFVAWITNFFDLQIQIQVVVFLIVAILCLFVTRPVAINKLKIGRIRTNADSLIGECFKVETTINNILNEGTVKAGGQIWSARASDEDIIEKDEIVCVKDIKGVKLIVERKK